MENYEIALMSDELYHHGIKGMKWGIRRYQNKDGSLTNAGKKRRSLGETVHDYKVNKQRKKSLEKARAAKEKKAEAERKHKEAFEKGKLSPKKMTNEELAAATKRLQDEQKYQEAMLETRPMRRLMDKAWKDAIVPGITKGGEELVKKAMLEYGGKALGLNKKEAKSAYDLLKEENDIAKWKKDIAENKQKLRDATDPEIQKLQTEATKAKLQKTIRDGVDPDEQQDNNNNDNTNNSKSNKKSQNETKQSSDKSAGVKGEKWTKKTTTTELSTQVVDRGRSYVDNNNGRRYRVDPDGTIEYID